VKNVEKTQEIEGDIRHKEISASERVCDVCCSFDAVGFGSGCDGRMLYVFWKARLLDAAKSLVEAKPPSSANIESATGHPSKISKKDLVTSWHVERS